MRSESEIFSKMQHINNDISPSELFQARVIWSNILGFDDAALLNWRTWAEETISAIEFVSPIWLCELVTAPTADDALRCVRDGIGLEYGEFPDYGIDELSLLFGLIYFKYSREDDWAQEAWRTMEKFGDVSEYVDARHWTRYQNKPNINLAGLKFEERTKIIFRPVAAYALRTVRGVFKKTEHVKAVMYAVS